MTAIQSWGRLSSQTHRIVPVQHPAHKLALTPLALDSRPRGIPFGMGRSYGDVCLNNGGVVWTTRSLDHLIHFDRESGRLIAEAGVLLRDLQTLALQAGWMLPVTPGTQMVTLGGAIANDVHGKNHHLMGSFGDHVLRLKLLRTDGEMVECGPNLNEGWFAATLGGIGLTGLVVEAELQLRRVPGPWLATETIPYGDLSEFFELSMDAESVVEYTVSWIDCLASSGGRGLFIRGNHCAENSEAVPAGRQVSMPMTPPFSLVNRLSLRPFNDAYFYLNARQPGKKVVHYRPFFYPLDNVQHWNRMYGPSGFYQYQCVVPMHNGVDATQEMLRVIGQSGQGSFLAVLKTFGDKASAGMLSFPMKGVTLALDFPNRGAQTLALFDKLDAIVCEAKGRIYLAKDARMPRHVFEQGYPKFADFINYADPGMSSEMSRRLMGI
jgi:FAD/FMN-containing dehydrogenase